MSSPPTLLKHPLRQSGEYKLTRVYDLVDLDFALTLSEGFSVKSADEHLDIPGDVALIKSAFDKEFFEKAMYETLRSSRTLKSILQSSFKAGDDGVSLQIESFQEEE